jgi:hypothetical protein
VWQFNGGIESVLHGVSAQHAGTCIGAAAFAGDWIQRLRYAQQNRPRHDLRRFTEQLLAASDLFHGLSLLLSHGHTADLVDLFRGFLKDLQFNVCIKYSSKFRLAHDLCHFVLIDIFG